MKTDRPLHSTRSLLVAALVLAAGPTNAQTTYDWLNANTDGEVFNPANWNPVGLPGAGDTIGFTNEGTLTATLDLSNAAGTAFSQFYFIQTDHLTLDLDGHELHTDESIFLGSAPFSPNVFSLVNTAPPDSQIVYTLYSGYTEIDGVTVQVGSRAAIVSDTIWIGDTVRPGFLEVNGTSGTALVSGTVFRIGAESAGAGSTVTVSNQGRITGDTLFVGDNGDGTLTIQNAAASSIDNTFDTVFIGSPTVNGTLNLSDADLLVNDQISFRRGGIHLSNGATLDVGQSAAFTNAIVDGTITGAAPDAVFSIDASTLNVTGGVRLGSSTTQLQISNGSDVDLTGGLLLWAAHGGDTIHTIDGSDVDLFGNLEVEGIGLGTYTELGVTGGTTLDAQALRVATSGSNSVHSEVNFDGAGTVGTFQQVMVQGEGSQGLYISGGAVVNATQIGNHGLLIGDGTATGSLVRISDPGSSLNLTGTATGTVIHTTPTDGTATLQVLTGATASLGLVEQYNGSVQAILGEIAFAGYYFAAGELQALGAGATLTGPSLQVGDDPGAIAPGQTASLLATEGALVDISAIMIIGGRGNDGQASFESGSILDAGTLRIGNWVLGSYPQTGDGELDIADAGTLVTVDNDMVIGSTSDTGVNGVVSLYGPAVLNVEGEISVEDTGLFNFYGGTIYTTDLHLDGEFNWVLGTLEFYEDTTFDAGKVDRLLGSSGGALAAGQELIVNGEATLLAPMVIDGGSFSYDTLANGHLLEIISGTVAVNSQLFITHGGELGRVVSVEDYTLVNPALNIYVEQDGVLQVRGTGEVIAGNIIELRGRVEMYDGTSYLRADGIGITGVLSGTGYVLADGDFAGDGDIGVGLDGEVRATHDQHLILDTAQITNGGTFYAHDAIIEIYSQDGGDLEFFNAPPFDDPEGGESSPGGHVILLDGGQLIMHEGELWNEGQVSVENAILRVPELSNHNDGVATFSGEETKLFGDLYLGEDARITISSETRAKFFDYAELEGDLFIGEGGLAIFFGDVEGSFDVSGNGGVEIHGDFSPGSSPGSVHIAGDLDLSASQTLRLEIAGDVQGDGYDFVGVGGRLTVGGELAIVLLEEWSPQAGEPAPGSRVDLLDWSILSGSFEDVAFEDDTDFFDASGLGINLHDLYNTGELRFELLGDVNTDGYVDVEDLDLLLARWGDSVNPYDYAAGDMSGDGLVGSADLQLVLDHWGDGTPPDVDVPEPGSAAVLMLGGLALLRRRRRV